MCRAGGRWGCGTERPGSTPLRGGLLGHTRRSDGPTLALRSLLSLRCDLGEVLIQDPNSRLKTRMTSAFLIKEKTAINLEKGYACQMSITAPSRDALCATAALGLPLPWSGLLFPNL